MKNYDALLAEVRGILSDDQHGHAPEFLSLDRGFELAKRELIAPPPAVKISGWDRFNEATGGLRPREFSILCGPTGSGKTTWLANLSSQLVISGVRHFVASVETGATDFVLRVMSALDQRDYNTGDVFNPEDVERFEKDFRMVVKSKMIELAPYTNKIKPHYMLADLLYASRELGCKVAILDNLNFFLPFTDSKESISSMDKVIHDFIIFCKHVDMHIIMVMHPKKTENGRVNSEFDIKGSSGAVQEAHNVFLFNRPSEQDEVEGYSKKEFRDLMFAKLRRRGQYVYRRIMYRNLSSSYVEMELK